MEEREKLKWNYSSALILLSVHTKLKIETIKLSGAGTVTDTAEISTNTVTHLAVSSIFDTARSHSGHGCSAPLQGRRPSPAKFRIPTVWLEPILNLAWTSILIPQETNPKAGREVNTYSNVSARLLFCVSLRKGLIGQLSASAPPAARYWELLHCGASSYPAGNLSFCQHKGFPPPRL